MAGQILEWEKKKRLLIISYEKEDDELITKSLNFISDNTCEIDDRSLELIFFEKFKNKNFEKPKFVNGYGIWLLGYDGEFKHFSSDSSILFNTLYYCILFSSVNFLVCSFWLVFGSYVAKYLKKKIIWRCFMFLMAIFLLISAYLILIQ